MAGPLSVADLRLHKLRSRVKDVKTNRMGCQLLLSLAERTLAIFHELEATHLESPIDAALELLGGALGDAEHAVEKCCNTATFIALLYNEAYAVPLKHAADKLAHALTAIPLASVQMSTDFQTDVDEFLAQVRNASFEDEDATSHHTQTLKDALERECYPSCEADQDVNTHTSVPTQDLISNKEDYGEDSLVPKAHENKATENRKKKQEMEANQPIPCASETSGDISEPRRIVADLKDCLHCPISKKIMGDPVILKDSGMTYDRSSITEWLEQGHQYDPITNVRLVSRDLVPINALRVASRIVLEQSESHSSLVQSFQNEDFLPSVEPGLYEGEGEFGISQLLILEPSGRVVGLTLYKIEGFGVPENNAEIGVGDWDGDKGELSFRDGYFNYHGRIDVLGSLNQAVPQLGGNVSIQMNTIGAATLKLAISSLSKPLSSKLHPTILQMEGNIDSASSQVTYKSKVVLSLEIDSTVGGWICFESSMQKSKTVGHIVEGRWDDCGRLAFLIHFMPSDAPSNYVDAFDIIGIIGHDEMLDRLTFVSLVTKAKNVGTLQNVKKKPTILSSVKHLEYQLVFEVSKHWHYLHPKTSRLFQASSDLDLKSLQAVSKARLDVKRPHDIHHRRAFEGSPTPTTLQNTNVDAFKEPVAIKKNANISSTNDEFIPLHIASQNNDVEVVKGLIVGGANVNLQANDGWSALHIASNKGHMDIVHELIVNGADVNLQKNDGASPLYIASSKGHIDSVKELIANGAQPNLQGNNGETPLYIASLFGHINVVKELIANGANVNLETYIGWSPLHYASDKGHVNVVKELIANGADVNLQTRIGWSPLHYASDKGHVNAVKELIASGANVNLKGDSGVSPLYIASDKGHIGVVTELIINGAYVDLQKDNGASALHIASKRGLVYVVQILLGGGAFKTIQDYSGKTPYDVVCTDLRHGPLDKFVIEELRAILK